MRSLTEYNEKWEDMCKDNLLFSGDRELHDNRGIGESMETRGRGGHWAAGAGWGVKNSHTVTEKQQGWKISDNILAEMLKRLEEGAR